MRFNHMELTLPKGSMDAKLREDIASFYGEVFGWLPLEVDVVGQSSLLLRVDEAASQFVLVAESSRPMQSPGYDHLGILLDSRSQVDALREKCLAFQQRDERVRIKDYDDLVQGPLTVHAFYVKYLLPIWFDVQNQEYAPGAAPARSWTYG